METAGARTLENKHSIALMDTSAISFMQVLQRKELHPETILDDYDLILIPQWVLNEINDAKGRAEYVQSLINQGYPIFSIAEERYSDLAENEEGNLYQIVLASARQIGRIRSYLRRYVEKTDPLDMDAYEEWISRLYEEWPVSDRVLSSGRTRKKNAGEVSITILAEIVSWYYPKTRLLTVYSQDSDTYEFQRKAEEELRKLFVSRTPVPISYKSNDAILCQLGREGIIDLDHISDYRKDERKITYSRELTDNSVILVTEPVNNEMFVKLVKDERVHIIF